VSFKFGASFREPMKTADALGCVAWASFFLLASAWIPFFGPFLSLLTPLPFILYTSKAGLLSGTKIAALTVLVVGVISQLTGRPQVILIALEFSILGFVLPVLFSRKFSLGYTLFFGTSFMLLLSVTFLFFIALSRGMGPFEMLFGYLNANVKEAIDAYESLGVGPENASDLEAYGEALIAAVSTVYPSLMIVGTGVVVWLNLVLSMHLLRMKKLAPPVFIPTERWRAPDKLVWVVILSGFSLFLLSGSVLSLAINVFILTMAIYLFHGLSILLFFLNKYKVPSWIRIGVYVLIAFQQLFLAVLALAGLFDQWVDFRKINKTETKPI
jgi:uncharacterized protein YybS (DUF2232 family)